MKSHVYSSLAVLVQELPMMGLKGGVPHTSIATLHKGEQPGT